MKEASTIAVAQLPTDERGRESPTRRRMIQLGLAAFAGAVAAATLDSDEADAAGEVVGESNDADAAVAGTNFDGGPGVAGRSEEGAGVLGIGVQGVAIAASALLDNTAFFATSNGGIAIDATTEENIAIRGQTTGRTAIRGVSDIDNGVWGSSPAGPGVRGNSEGNRGVSGESRSGPGVFGRSDQSFGVHGQGFEDPGVFGEGFRTTGVRGFSELEKGVDGQTVTGIGVHGHDSLADEPGIGVRAQSHAGRALEVMGRAHFSSAGNAFIPAGESSVEVPYPTITAESHVGVTLMSDPAPPGGEGGNGPIIVPPGHDKGKGAGKVLFHYVERKPGTGFVVHLTGEATQDTPFAAFVVEPI